MNKDYKKILVKNIKIFLSKKKYGKNIIESEKMSYRNYKKLLFKKMT